MMAGLPPATTDNPWYGSATSIPSEYDLKVQQLQRQLQAKEYEIMQTQQAMMAGRAERVTDYTVHITTVDDHILLRVYTKNKDGADEYIGTDFDRAMEKLKAHMVKNRMHLLEKDSLKVSK